MKIEFIKRRELPDHTIVEVGDVVELAEADAIELIQQEMAKEYPDGDTVPSDS